MERIAVFIDAGFVDKVANAFGIRFDYGKLAKHVASDGKLIRAFFYFCRPYRSSPPTTDENERYNKHQQFISRLQQMDRFELREGRLHYRGKDQQTGRPIFEQKRVDVMMALDLVRVARSNQFQRAILLTGDSDFVPAINMAKDEGLEVVLYYQRGSAHEDLVQCCDVAHAIEQSLIDATRLPAPSRT
jgi:uncharacterized LabA/DUF88 family protein